MSAAGAGARAIRFDRRSRRDRRKTWFNQQRATWFNQQTAISAANRATAEPNRQAEA
jgi:hypothetical protein